MAAKAKTRKSPRAACGLPAVVEGPRGPVRGVCKSISQAGMFFTGSLLPVGQSIEVAVEMSGARSGLRATGVVSYHHTSSEGPGMGIKFTRLSQDDQASIGRFVEAHAG
jgi:hypothetical protein